MSSTDMRSPTRLPQPMAPISPTEDGNALNGSKGKESRRRSMLPQRSISGGRGGFTTESDLEGAGDNSNSTAATAAESGPVHPMRSRNRLGSVAETGQRNDSEDEHEDVVAAQRQAALDALMGDTSNNIPQAPGHTRASSSQSKLSRMIPKPGAAKGSMPPPSLPTRASSVRKPGTSASTASRPERSSRMLPPSAAASAVSRSQARHAPSSSTGSARPSSRSSSGTTTTGAASGRPPSSSFTRPPSASSMTGRTSRSGSGSATAGATTGLRRNSSTREPTKASTKPTTAAPTLQAKPQFTTFQQHYSPKKDLAPKPLTSSFLPKAPAPHLSSRQAPESPSADVSRQQAELLQLSLLHEQGVLCLSAFSASARAKLRTRFERLATRCSTVQQAERAARTPRNVAALHEWGAGGAIGGLQENVRVLSSVLRELAALQREEEYDAGNDGDGIGRRVVNSDQQMGRFDQVLEQFTAWMAWAEDVWDARSSHAAGTDMATTTGDLDILLPLPPDWHAEVAALQRKTALLIRELDCLDVPQPGSSVADVLTLARASLGGIAEELKVMKALGAAVMVKEAAWVDEQVSGLTVAEIDAV